jgi:hypothetical protein
MKLEPVTVRLELGYENARTASDVVERINAVSDVKVTEEEVIKALAWCVRNGSVAEYAREGETYYFRR